MKPWRLDDGMEVLIHPIRPEDESMMVHFHATLKVCQLLGFRLQYSPEEHVINAELLLEP